MQEPLLPLFPLEVVLLPGTPIPLHVFEERYKRMIGECVRNKTEFGIVQSGEQGILNIGCTATVEKILKHYPDGRMDIVAMGRRRFEIILVDQEEDYLRAAVSFFDDDDTGPAPAEVRALAVASLHALQAAEGGSGDILPDQHDPQLSFKVAFFVPDLPLRQTLLSLRSETERLKQLNEFLPDLIVKTRRIAHVKRVAPMNGHGMMVAGAGETDKD